MEEPVMAKVVRQLKAATPEQRKSLLAQLAEISKGGLGYDDALYALKAAAADWPDDEVDVSDALVQVALVRPYREFAIMFGEFFPKYSPAARRRMIDLLVDTRDELAATVYAKIVRNYAKDGIVPATKLSNFLDIKKASRILIPSLLEYLNGSDLDLRICRLALDMAWNKYIKREALDPYAEYILNAYRPRREEMRSREEPEGYEWKWNDRYQKLREDMILILFLMSYVRGETIVEALSESLNSRDLVMACWAARGLMANGCQIPPEKIEEMAACAESRNCLFELLDSENRLELFPQRYANQEAMAESVMVEWLASDEGPGRAPDEIELMETFTEEDSEELYCLFRFQNLAPHPAADAGWMAGLAGPFWIEDKPSTMARNHPVSLYEKWESKKPVEHYRSLRAHMTELRRKELAIDYEAAGCKSNK